MVINHRHTRTGFVNARHDSEWRKRKRRASVLVCGFTINGVPCGGCYTRRCTVSVRLDVFPSDAARCRVSMGSVASALVINHGHTRTGLRAAPCGPFGARASPSGNPTASRRAHLRSPRL